METLKQIYDLITTISVKGDDTIKMANIILLIRQELSKAQLQEEQDG